MAFLRNVVFILSFLFVGSGFAIADTLPAVQSYSYSGAGQVFSSVSAACSHARGALPIGTCSDTDLGWKGNNNQAGTCRRLYGGSCLDLAYPYGTLTCPSGGTLSGTNCINVPACTPPQVRDAATGQCIDPPCSAGAQVASATYFGGWRVGTATNAVVGPNGQSYFQPPPETICDGTCIITMTTSGSCSSESAPYVNSPQPIMCVGTGQKTGGSCSTNSAATGDAPVIPNHRPKCLPGEGVLTSSAGTVACVPSGVPASTPVVRTEKQTQQFPDGSSRTTETTYTKDPVSQVQDTQQQITNTPATGGAPGQSGPVGTTTTAESTSPSSPTDKEASDFCKANGQLQICKGDMNKEETQIQVRDYIKSLTDPASTPYSELDDAKQSTQSDAELKEQTDKFQAAAEGTFSPDSASRSSWQSAMESGWFEPVTRQGCQPYTATVGGRTWNLDICPTAEKISGISEYVIWFLLVVGTFVMMTGGAFTRNS